MTGNQSCVHFLTIVQWLKKRDEETFKHYGKPTETWHSNMLDRDGPSTHIPVQRIKSKFVFAYDVIRGKMLLLLFLEKKMLC